MYTCAGTGPPSCRISGTQYRYNIADCWEMTSSRIERNAKNPSRADWFGYTPALSATGSYAFKESFDMLLINPIDQSRNFPMIRVELLPYPPERETKLLVKIHLIEIDVPLLDCFIHFDVMDPTVFESRHSHA